MTDNNNSSTNNQAYDEIFENYDFDEITRYSKEKIDKIQLTADVTKKEIDEVYQNQNETKPEEKPDEFSDDIKRAIPYQNVAPAQSPSPPEPLQNISPEQYSNYHPSPQNQNVVSPTNFNHYQPQQLKNRFLDNGQFLIDKNNYNLPFGHRATKDRFFAIVALCLAFASFSFSTSTANFFINSSQSYRYSSSFLEFFFLSLISLFLSLIIPLASAILSFFARKKNSYTELAKVAAVLSIISSIFAFLYTALIFLIYLFD